MLSDAQWAVLEPLIEVRRPHAEVPPSNLRRTLSAILWRHEKSGGSGPKGAFKLSETQVKRLAVLVAALEPRPA